jgi:ribosomal protein S18 acetylase RimI-like enzyme
MAGTADGLGKHSLPYAVRGFAPADARGVIDLWHRTGISRPWHDLEAEIRLHARRDGDLLLVAFAGATIVGAVMGAWDGRRGWIYHLAVDPAWRGRGAGRALLEEAERRLAALGCPKVMLMVRAENLGVAGFYLRQGYGPEDVRVFSKWLVEPPGAAPPATGG